MALKFDSTINLGHVFTMGALLFAGVAGYTSIQVSLTELKKDISGIQEYKVEQKTINDKINERFDRIQDRLRALEMTKRTPHK